MPLHARQSSCLHPVIIRMREAGFGHRIINKSNHVSRSSFISAANKCGDWVPVMDLS